MRTILILVLLSSYPAIAQDWALINPAYRYNYSNDGTDTISNQIRVMHVDTLGVDSFRYELNKVGEPCVGCPLDCSVRLNIPQFLNAQCTVSDHIWLFTDPEEVTILSTAPLGQTWTFDPANNVSASVVDITWEQVLDTMDSVRTVATTANDTIRWGKQLGLLRWKRNNGSDHALIGIHGPDRGELIPSVGQFFRYEPGDVVYFRKYSTSSMNYSTYYERFRIDDRSETSDVLTFSGTLDVRAVHNGGVSTSTYSIPYNWPISLSNYNSYFACESSPQGAARFDPGSGGNNKYYIARHGIDVNGFYTISAISLGQYRTFVPSNSDPLNCGVLLTEMFNGYSLNSQLGTIYYGSGYPSNYYTFSTVGAIIAGDTIGTIYTENTLHVGIEEENAPSLLIHPNPSSDLVRVDGVHPGVVLRMNDCLGKEVYSTVATGHQTTIDVSGFPAGLHWLRVDNGSSVPLLIVRD